MDHALPLVRFHNHSVRNGTSRGRQVDPGSPANNLPWRLRARSTADSALTAPTRRPSIMRKCGFRSMTTSKLSGALNGYMLVKLSHDISAFSQHASSHGGIGGVGGGVGGGGGGIGGGIGGG